MSDRTIYDERGQQAFSEIMGRLEQDRLNNQVAELKKDPHKFARTTLFAASANQNEYTFAGGTDKDGNDVSFGYTVGRNLAGFFLTFKEVTVKESPDRWSLRYENIQPHKKRKNAKRVSAERADAERERNGLEKQWQHYYEETGPGSVMS